MTLESISYEDPQFNPALIAKGDPPPNGEGGEGDSGDPPPNGSGDPPPNGSGDPPPNGAG